MWLFDLSPLTRLSTIPQCYSSPCFGKESVANAPTTLVVSRRFALKFFTDSFVPCVFWVHFFWYTDSLTNKVIALSQLMICWLNDSARECANCDYTVSP